MGAGQIIPLDRSDDPRLTVFADLRHADVNHRGQFFIAEGRLVVNRLIASEYPVVSVLVQRGCEHEYASQQSEEVPVYSLPKDQLSDLVGFDFHRGVIGCGRRLPARRWDEYAGDDVGAEVSLALLGITEQENLGNIFRTAAAFGISRVLLGPGTVDPLARRVLRVSMATVLKLQLHELTDPIHQIPRLRDRFRLRTVASTLQADATPIDQFDHDGRPILLMLGHEAEGIDADLQQAACDRITIPMQLGVDSLNVSIATAILIYELTKSLR